MANDPPRTSAHPGTVVFENHIAGTTETRSAESLPRDEAYVTIEGAEVPVTRAVLRPMGSRCTLTLYGADGRVLSHTILER